MDHFWAWKLGYPCTCIVVKHDFVKEEVHSLGCEASVVVLWQRKWGIWADINSPIKNRRTQTNKVAANWRGEGGGGGDTVQKWNVLMFSCSTNRSYVPPQSTTWADIARDSVWAVKHTFSERSLDGQFVLLHPVIFYSSRDMVCVFTGMDGNGFDVIFKGKLN